MSSAGFLGEPEPSNAVEAMYAGDRDDPGYVMNLTRAWANAPELNAAWETFATAAARAAGLTFRLKGIVVSAVASELRDSYCSFASGNRLATAIDAETADAVLTGGDEGLDATECTIAAWARRLVRDPNSTTQADVDALRRAGLDDRAIVGLTAHIAARIAFSTVNDALGAAPEAELHASPPDAVREAITWGRVPG